jgi:exosortase F-associated protein
MLQKLFNLKVRIALAVLLVIILVLVRAYEDSLFYDPFLNYFKSDYNNLPLPEINNLNLFIGLLFRYFLNSAFSLAIIYLLFKDLQGLKFASMMYVILFVLLVIVFFCTLSYPGGDNKMVLFYIRRFLIQPIFLLLFLSAFYYQKLNK